MPFSPLLRAPARRFVGTVLATVAVVLVFAPPAGAAKLMNYNLLNWGGVSGVARVPNMRLITEAVAPDLIVTEEMTDQAGVDLYLNSVLNANEPGQWAAGPHTEGPDTDSGIFYKPSKWSLLDVFILPTELRHVYRYHLRLAGYTSPGAELYAYVFHLKASTGFEAQRAYEMRLIRRNADSLAVGSHVVFCGDYNVYTSSEPAYVKAMQDTATNIGRMKDPINKPGSWNNNMSLAPYHTQSTRRLSFGGGANGGMDDRFDFILESYNLDDGVGLELDESTYKAFGNDGLHCCNAAINDPPTNAAVGQVMADTLMTASDHLPVVATFIVPSQLGLGTNAIAFGTVIVGAPAVLPLAVSNTADTPGDALDYTLGAPTGFSAPTGPFTIPAGAPGLAHSITMDTSTPGVRSGQLDLTTDAPDFPHATVALSGTVVAHATPSTDSLAVAVADTIDFGSQEAGGFNDQPAFVWNQGFGALQSRLLVNGAEITGEAAARFSLVEPFAPTLLELDAARYDVHFDDSSILADSTFEARLTFHGADDPALPGAAARGDVSYVLMAHFTVSLVGVEPDAPPTATLLYAPSPNPARVGRIALRFDLAEAGRASIELYDVRGRRVAVITDGERPAGRHTVAWNGLDEARRPVASGVYFARLVTARGAQSKRFLVLQ